MYQWVFNFHGHFSEHSLPELLPCGYLVGENTNITVTLKGTFKTSFFIEKKDVITFLLQLFSSTHV